MTSGIKLEFAYDRILRCCSTSLGAPPGDLLQVMGGLLQELQKFIGKVCFKLHPSRNLFFYATKLCHSPKLAGHRGFHLIRRMVSRIMIQVCFVTRESRRLGTLARTNFISRIPPDLHLLHETQIPDTVSVYNHFVCPCKCNVLQKLHM